MILLSILQTPQASAHHSLINASVVPPTGDRYYSGDHARLLLSISTGNLAGNEITDDGNAVQYNAKYTLKLSGQPDVPAREWTEGLFVPPNTILEHEFEYPHDLTVGKWILYAEVHESLQTEQALVTMVPDTWEIDVEARPITQPPDYSNYIIAGIGVGGLIAAAFIGYFFNKKERTQKLRDQVALENAKRDREAADKAGIRGKLAVRDNGDVGNDHAISPADEKMTLSENIVAVVKRGTVPAPQIEVVNTRPEPFGQSQILSYFPNFRNDGVVTISNITIGHRILDEVLDLRGIMKLEQEIKSSYIRVPGSIAPTKSINLNDGRKGIEWQKGDKPVNVVLWFSYEFENGYDEVIFNIRYDLQFRPVGSVIRYTSSDIGKVRQAGP